MKSWACGTVSGATAVSSPAPSAATSPMAQRASAQAENTNRAAGERGGEAPEFEDALLADGTGRQDGGAHDLKHEERVLEILLSFSSKATPKGRLGARWKAAAAAMPSKTADIQNEAVASAGRAIVMSENCPPAGRKERSVRGFQALRLRRALALRRLFEGTWPQHVAFVVAQPEEPPHQRDEGEVRSETRGKCAKRD